MPKGTAELSQTLETKSYWLQTLLVIAKEGFIPNVSPVDSTALTPQPKHIRNEVTRPAFLFERPNSQSTVLSRMDRREEMV